MSMIEVEDLRKNYGNFRALRGVEFSVDKGEILGFLGPNGAGKTTTFNMLSGMFDGGCCGPQVRHPRKGPAH